VANLPKIKVSFPELSRLMREFDALRPALARKHMRAAIRRSLAPGIAALRSTTPKGPTGNLRRAIDSKIAKYRSGNVVGLVGYRKAGTSKTVPTKGSVMKGRDRAYHQKFLEFGTRDRYTKGSIASSFKRLGPFTFRSAKSNARNLKAGRRLTAQAQRLFARGARADAGDARRGIAGPGRGGFLRSQGAAKLGAAGAKFGQTARVQTSPGYPKAFFKRAAKGQRVYLSSMPIGGSTGQPPVRTAYRMALPSMRALLPDEMAKALQKALKDMADKFPRKYGPAAA
jgi:hypothetical protein